MIDPADKLTPADPRDLADALAFALRFQGRKRVHNADEIMSDIVAKRLVEHLERAGFVVMKRPATGGGHRAGPRIRGVTAQSHAIFRGLYSGPGGGRAWTRFERLGKASAGLFR